MLNIGIIDAEIIGKHKHRFPNLACMKLSSWYKSQGHNVKLCLSYNDVDSFDKVFISKVFVKTDIPMEDKSVEKTELNCSEYYKQNDFLKNPNIEYGGTGFFYEKGPRLPFEIEHCMPDYHLYDEWIAGCISNGASIKEFKYYTDYSIGFLTRGCFRKCQFCVNKIYNKCTPHSPLNEFMDMSRPKLCFLDDNFFACSNWLNIINVVKAANKRFQFKQGLDERLLTKEKISEINLWKYDGEFIFAFDNIEDEKLIKDKLELIYATIPEWKKQIKFYCFTGFDRVGVYDDIFWRDDITNLVYRMIILSKYSAIPYVMRHENYKNSPYQAFYNAIAAWGNQPQFFKSFTLEEFCKCRGMKFEGYKKYKKDINGYLAEYGKDSKGSSWVAYEEYVEKNGDNKLFHIIPRDNAKYGANVV